MFAVDVTDLLLVYIKKHKKKGELAGEMNKTLWHDRYSIGVSSIDKEHKQLFSMMAKLFALNEDEEKSVWACKEAVKFLKNHTIQHFQNEEAYMRSINYDGLDTHKRLHDNFLHQTLPALESELEVTEYSAESVRHFLGVCIGWVVAHTQTEDQAIAGKVQSKWADIPHEEEMDALKLSIIQIFDDMFHLKVKVINESYGGEDFGKIVCNRFLYREETGEKWEILLIFEEKLLLKTISEILNTQYQKVNDMVVNIARYLSKQMLEKIRESIPSIDLCELEKESLLTYDQLTKAFEREHLPCSILFSTENGYFAFCATNSDSVKGRIMPSIDSSNAMQEINKFLNKSLTTKKHMAKKKILLVDDSDFVRSWIMGMLGEDYEIYESNSSVSAIRSIAVNRPDLILLDYEMPVCDGRQMLEMLRADPASADIPVIFLTGKGDKDSIRRVVSLKPEGYLLKNMADAEIKKNIDKFFAGNNGKQK